MPSEREAPELLCRVLRALVAGATADNKCMVLVVLGAMTSKPEGAGRDADAK